jgi:hypothetical protein
MYLKGEGMDAGNTSKALELYTDAAERGSVKALNGLGYIYFYGQGGLAQNYVRLYQLFYFTDRGSGSILSNDTSIIKLLLLECINYNFLFFCKYY